MDELSVYSRSIEERSGTGRSGHWRMDRGYGFHGTNEAIRKGVGREVIEFRSGVDGKGR